MTSFVLNGDTVTLLTGRYESNERLAVYLESDGEPYLYVSVNLPNEPLADGEFVVKTYSENDGVFEVMLAANLISFTGRLSKEMSLPICTLCQPAPAV